MIPLFAGIPGGPEVLIIAGIGILLFGADRIPQVARSLGTSFGEFRKGKQQLEDELDDVQSDVETTVTEAGKSASDGVNPGGDAEQ